MNQYETHIGTIYKQQNQTLYVRWGNWLNWVLLGLGIVMIMRVIINQ